MTSAKEEEDMKWKYVRIFLMGLLCLISNVELFSQYCLKMSYDRNGNRISMMLDECMEILRDTADDAVEKDTSDEVLVYPNPNNGKFNVDLKNVADSPAQLYVYDSKGVLIRKQIFIGTTVVDVSKNPAGAYLLRIISDDIEKNLIVIKH